MSDQRPGIELRHPWRLVCTTFFMNLILIADACALWRWLT